MPGIQFLHSLMLAGLTALAIPVLIHLLLRQRQKRVRFSTVQFFFKKDEIASRRRKLRNWLLLAIRLLIFTLLVLAFSRPFLRDARTAGMARKQRQVILVLDRSASMQAIGTAGPNWPRAKEAVRKVLSELMPDDRVGLVGCASQVDVLSGLASPTAIVQLMDKMQPAFGTANLGGGLQQAGRLLTTRDPNVASTIYVLSDFQRNSCPNLASYPIPPEIEVKLLPVGDRVTPNLAVTDLQMATTDGAKPYAVVSSYADEDSVVENIRFSIDGQRVWSRAIELTAGASTNVELSLPPLKPGWHEAQAVIESKDAFPLDDIRYQTFFIPQPVRALVVETRDTRRPYEEASFFVTTALDPGKDSTNSMPRPFVFEKSSPQDLLNALSHRPSQQAYDLVLLPGLKSIPSGMGKVLSDFVQSGGGLVLFLGEGISVNRYQSEFGPFLPAPLGNLDISADWESAWRIGDYDTNTAAFAAFGQPNSGNLALPRFLKRFTLLPHSTNSVLARFQDGSPLVVAGSFGRGRVVLVNTSADTEWTDWPKHKSFVPWLHGTGHYVIGKANSSPTQTTTNYMADSEVVIETSAANTQFKLQPPGGESLLLSADGQGRLSAAALAVPGIYSLRDMTGLEVRRLAVNLPSQESDLTALPPLEFQQQLTRAWEAPQSVLTAGFLGLNHNQKELWRSLLLVVLVLLLLETIVANRNLV